MIDDIDPKNCISYRLYRQHTWEEDDGSCTKDISKLGRKMNKILIIDNIKNNYRRQPENGIFISTWCGEEKDDELRKLC